MRPKSGIGRSQQLFDKMMSALDELHKEKTIDLIVFSGDMIDRGGEGFQSTDIAFANFRNLIATKITDRYSLDKSRFVFVPGNHDVQRYLDKKFMETGLQSDLINTKAVDDFVHDPSNLDCINRIKAFNKFQEDYYKDIEEAQYFHTPLQSNLILNIDGKKIGITMLNSAWRCYDSAKDKGNILIGENQILDSLEYIKDCDLRIAVSHHDYNWVKDFERPVLPKLISQHYNMFFCGHTHGADAELICRPEGNTFFFTAPGLLHANVHELDGNYKNGFMVVDCDLEKHVIIASKYVQAYDREFSLDKNYGENGFWVRDIPRGEVAIRNERIADTYSHINSLIPQLNAHLIGYRTTTNAPKDINSLFVMPSLQYNEQTGDDIESVKKVDVNSIAEIIELEGNIIIYGDKESGKTILLDKILIDVSSQHRSKNMMPAQIRFSSIKNNIIALLSSYWDQRTNDAISILQEKKVVLLIDNVNFSNEYSDKIDNIKDFLAKYPNVRLICTTQGRNTVGTTGPSDQIIPSSRSLQIASFKAEQIRELAGKWYNVSMDDDCLRERLEFIINAFNTFKLPCTPFSVTLLLWIMEKGGQIQPTNSAILLDTFMQEMLKDQTGDFGKEKFNQFNKIRLLSAIALEMYNEEVIAAKENRPYSFTYGALTLLVEKHLKAMEMSAFKPTSIINKLIDVGVLIQVPGSNKMYFRFRCFMEYFLAKQMNTSEDFFNHVLSEANYLDFSNVINYYTGFTCDKVSVLNKIITRLEIEYLDLSTILGETIKVDDYFIRKGLLEAIDNPELDYLSPHKHTVKEDDKISNALLQQSEQRVQTGDKQKKHVNSFRVYSELLILAMDVLKNTEEVKESGFKLKLDDDENRTKTECFRIVLENSILYAIIFYIVCMKYIKKNENDASKQEKVKELSMCMFLLPVLHEELLRDHLGSIKLLDPIKDMLEADIKNPKSELQQFMTTFMYGDLKGKNYLDYIKSFIISSKRAFIRDSCFLKLQQYYYNSNDSKLDRKLAEMMADLYISSHKSKRNEKHFNKGVITERFLKNKGV